MFARICFCMHACMLHRPCNHLHTTRKFVCMCVRGCSVTPPIDHLHRLRSDDSLHWRANAWIYVNTYLCMCVCICCVAHLVDMHEHRSAEGWLESLAYSLVHFTQAQCSLLTSLQLFLCLYTLGWTLNGITRKSVNFDYTKAIVSFICAFLIA